MTMTILHSARATQQQRLPVSGKIRPGIKVLTLKTAAMPGATKVYEDGVQCGASFDDIEKSLKAKIKGCPDYPLTPRNVGYFRVCAEDFLTPGAAAEIMKRYAGPDGLLREFPVIFPSDDIDLVFTQQFIVWKSTTMVFWSEPNPSTNTLECMRYKPLSVRPKNRRVRFGGRESEKVRDCDPNDCDSFGMGMCKNHGTLRFYVPGCPGIGLIELHFTSIYAKLGISEVLAFVKEGLGYIRGTYNAKPIFWITKTEDNVSRVDHEKGTVERTDQWIIKIEARGLDMAEVLAFQETGGQLLLPPSTPQALLAAPPEPIQTALIEPPKKDTRSNAIESKRQQTFKLVKTLGFLLWTLYIKSSSMLRQAAIAVR